MGFPKHYCFTLNNPTAADEDALRASAATAAVQYLICGHEVAPTTGTPHFQCYIQLKNPTRFSTIQNWNDTWKRCAFPDNGKTQGTDEHNYKYCRKIRDCDTVPNEVWWEIGERIPMGKKGQRNDLNDVKAMIDEGKTFTEIVDAHFGTVSRCHKFVQACIELKRSGESLKRLREQCDYTARMPWQINLLASLESPPDKRKIKWIWSAGYGKGKSTTAEYLDVFKGALIISGGKIQDIAYQYRSMPSIVIFDLPRTFEQKMDHLYAIAESMKNGFVTSTKYEPVTIRHRAHVIFFTNFSPDLTKWSADRYDIECVD